MAPCRFRLWHQVDAGLHRARKGREVLRGVQGCKGSRIYPMDTGV